jgi:MFS family permease
MAGAEPGPKRAGTPAGGPGGGVAAPGRVAVLLGIAQTLAWATTFYLPAVVAPAVLAETAGDPVVIHGAFSLALLVAGLSAPATGRAIQRLGGRGVLAASSLVLALGLGLLGLLPGPGGWFAGWIVVGFGMALGLYEAAFATLGMLFGRAARRPITLVTLFAGFASTVGWPMTAALLPALGWRGTCLAYAALHLVAILPLYLALPRGTAPPEAAGAAGDGGAPPASAAWARRAFLLLAAFFTLRAFVSATLAVHVVALLGGLGLGMAAAIAVASLQGPAQVAGRLVEFAIGARAHPLTVARAGALLLPLGALAGLAGGPGAAIAFILCYGASNGVMTISRGAVPLVLFGPRGYPVLMGRLALPVLLAQAAAPTVTAPLVAAWPAGWLLAAAGAIGIVALACLLPLRAAAAGLRG